MGSLLHTWRSEQTANALKQRNRPSRSSWTTSQVEQQESPTDAKTHNVRHPGDVSVWSFLSDALINLVGQQNARNGIIKIFNALQETSANKHLLYVRINHYKPCLLEKEIHVSDPSDTLPLSGTDGNVSEGTVPRTGIRDCLNSPGSPDLVLSAADKNPARSLSAQTRDTRRWVEGGRPFIVVLGLQTSHVRTWNLHKNCVYFRRVFLQLFVF